MKIRNVISLIGLLFLSAVSFGVTAQTEPSSLPADRQTKKYSVLITDGKDAPTGSFGTDDLVVKVDGKPAQRFTVNTVSAPLLTALAVDNSGSMRMILGDIIETAKKIVGSSVNTEPILLMRFVGVDKIQASDKFTTDKLYLYRTLDSFYIEGGQTALIDAVYKGVELLDVQTDVDDSYRRVMIVISDGEDRASVHTEKQLVALLREKNVHVVFVGLTSVLDGGGRFTRKSPKKQAAGLIETIVNESGGFALYPEDISEFPLSAGKIMAALRDQYVVEVDVPSVNSKVEIELSKEFKKKKYVLFALPLK